ncbi:MAG TPA: phosphatidylinositol mannoside acyltransferase [Acidimicrobiia bacterium]|nr:phosphatidylinositol mannoside acyltransferase [Acidimicrobiia bacterium]
MRDRLGYAVYRVLSGLFGLLPEPVMRRMGHGIGWAASFIARRRFAMAVRHQTRVLGSSADARRSARRVFIHYGRYWAEVFWMRARRREAALARTQMDGVHNLHDAVATGRGVVLALPHMGNWEIGGLRAAREGARVLAVAEDLGNQHIVRWFIEMRAMLEIDIVIARAGSGVSRALLDRLNNGGVIALLCDRDIGGKGIPAVVFGEPTTLPAGPVALADRSGAVLLPAGTYFNEGAGHRFDIHPPLEIPDLPDSGARVAAGTQRLAEVMEEIIGVAPEQWHLVQPNWPSDREV